MLQTDGRVKRNQTWAITAWEDTPIWNQQKAQEARARGHGEDIDQMCVVFQPEVCPTTGRRHWQGVVRFHRGLTAAQVRDILQLTNSWLGVTNGSFHNNIKYCVVPSKADPDVERWFRPGPNLLPQPMHEYGCRPAPDASAGFLSITDALKAGQSMEELALSHTGEMMRYHRGVTAVMQYLHRPPVNRTVEVFLLYGPTGTGKSHAVLSLFPEAFVKPDNKPGEVGFFDGYDRQDVMLLDDFRPDWPLKALLRALDKWPYPVNVKHGSMTAYWTKVFITTNVPFEQWAYHFNGTDQATLAALARRIPPENRYHIKTRQDSNNFIDWFKKRTNVRQHVQNFANALENMTSEQREDSIVVRHERLARALNIAPVAAEVD